MTNGQLSIMRVSGDTQYIEITITDDASGVEFVTAKLTLEAFAKAITGLSFTDCEIKTRNLDLVGKQREHKSELIPCNGWNLSKRDKEVFEYECQLILGPYEIDGWIGSRYDMGNSKNYVKDEFVKVSFVRYVEVAR